MFRYAHKTNVFQPCPSRGWISASWNTQGIFAWASGSPASRDLVKTLRASSATSQGPCFKVICKATGLLETLQSLQELPQGLFEDPLLQAASYSLWKSLKRVITKPLNKGLWEASVLQEVSQSSSVLHKSSQERASSSHLQGRGLAKS